jgi:arylformamidase
MMRIIDISRSLSGDLKSWPGDTAFEFGLPVRRGPKVNVNVGAFRCSTHAGTHADAPFHYSDSATTVDQLSLGLFFGEAEVIDARGSGRIEFTGSSRTPERVLFRTDGWLDTHNFPSSVPTLTDEAITNLRNAGVRLVGVDVPSVDEIDSHSLPNHLALQEAGITIVESLWLKGIDAGRYTFAGFPLNITGADAAPVRAVLIV